jgi:hypothetical protein
MPIKKVTVNLPAEQVAFLQQVAAEEDLTFTDILRRSISSERFFLDNEKANRKILVEEPLTQRMFEVRRTK